MVCIDMKLKNNFLKRNEIADLERLRKNQLDLVGQTDMHADWERWRWEALAKRFAKYPVEWANSSDRMYQLPYEDDLLTAIAKERASRVEEDSLGKQDKVKPMADPWTYQEGYIFEAQFMRQSPKAFMIRLKGFGTTWVPKSQVDFPKPYREIWLPMWLMKDKGLVPAEAPPELNPPFEWEPALIPKKKRRNQDE